MAAITPHYLDMLKGVLTTEYVPHLLPLIRDNKGPEHKALKNLSRAFSAYVLRQQCGISVSEAAKAVVDDYDDAGLDAIYYDAPTQILYLLQGKIKPNEQFQQEEAQAFCAGCAKLLREDYGSLNAHIVRRRPELEDAIERCSKVQMLIAYLGPGVSDNALRTMAEFAVVQKEDEERLASTVIQYSSEEVCASLVAANAYPSIKADLWIFKSQKVEEPKVTYFGLIPVVDLVNLHNLHGKALYDRNIRTYLGVKTDVNKAIRKTLEDAPADFFYLNNGVTALCSKIDPKTSIRAAMGNRRKLVVHDLSVINGAQTIASAAMHLAENPTSDIAQAKVMLTLVQARADGAFGNRVTRARNHQNPVLTTHFVALQDIHERLRRELLYAGVHYAYKAEAADATVAGEVVRVEEAAQALAMFHDDPRYAVWAKRDANQLLDIDNDRYAKLFHEGLTSAQLLSAVRFSRHVSTLLDAQVTATVQEQRRERAIYRHGNYAVGWILAKQVRLEFLASKVFKTDALATNLSLPFDELRSIFETRMLTPDREERWPLGFLKNQTLTLPLMDEVMEEHFGLIGHPVVAIKRGTVQGAALEDLAYNRDLFNYMVAQAPQLPSVA